MSSGGGVAVCLFAYECDAVLLCARTFCIVLLVLYFSVVLTLVLLWFSSIWAYRFHRQYHYYNVRYRYHCHHIHLSFSSSFSVGSTGVVADLLGVSKRGGGVRELERASTFSRTDASHGQSTCRSGAHSQSLSLKLERRFPDWSYFGERRT